MQSVDSSVFAANLVTAAALWRRNGYAVPTGGAGEEELEALEARSERRKGLEGKRRGFGCGGHRVKSNFVSFIGGFNLIICGGIQVTLEQLVTQWLTVRDGIG